MTDPAASLPDLLDAARARFAARDAGAEALYRAVLDHDPRHPEALDRCARFALHHRRPAEAAALLARLDAVRPDAAPVLALLGRAQREAGDKPAAARTYGRLTRVAPGDAEAWKHLGALLLDLNDAAAAERAYAAAVAAVPADGELWFNLAVTRRRIGRTAEALAAVREAAGRMADRAPALRLQGRLLHDLGRKDEAIAVYGALVALRPDDVEAGLTLGSLHKDRGDWRQAVAVLDAVPRDPGLTRAGLVRTMARLPMLYRDEAEIAAARASYADALADLTAPRPQTPQAVAEAAAAVGAAQPYYLPYQGRDDRGLQETYGRTLQAAMAARHPAWSVAPAVAPPAAGEPLRVGLVSGFFRWHTIWKLFLRGWMTGLDRRRVRLTAYATDAIEDATTAEARAGFERFVPCRPFAAMAETIRADANHVLIWPEVGMDPMAAQLACLRLAPVQCVSWGHPDTTGLPTMDWFLTSDLMEPPGEAARYSERVERLPGLGIAYPPLPEPFEAVDFAARGIPDDAVLYLCCQYLSKYLPQHDRLLARIARRVPNARFAFIAVRRPLLEALLRERLTAAFAAEGLRADDHVVFLPYMAPGVYAALNERADVYLDTIGWSGGNTTLEAVAHGLPVVTLPGDFMRGRHSAAILRQIGVTDTIAGDTDAYVDLAVRLGLDADWRAEIGARTRDGCRRIHDDAAPLRALEDFLDRVARGGSGEDGGDRGLA